MQNTGAEEKGAAVEEMRAAKAMGQNGGDGVAKNETLGKAEQMAGNVTGCEGMSEEGVKRMG